MRQVWTFAVLLLAGCASIDDRQIGAGSWQAVDLNGIAVIAEAPISLRLEGGRTSGNAGCNDFSGTVAIARARQRVRFTELVTTRKGCAPQVMDQERRFLSILENVTGYNFYADDSLSLVAADGRAVRLRRI